MCFKCSECAHVSVFTPAHKHYKSRVSHRARSLKVGKSRSSVRSRSRVHPPVPTPTHCPLCYTASHYRSCLKCKSCARPRAFTHTNRHFAPDAALAPHCKFPVQSHQDTVCKAASHRCMRAAVFKHRERVRRACASVSSSVPFCP